MYSIDEQIQAATAGQQVWNEIRLHASILLHTRRYSKLTLRYEKEDVYQHILYRLPHKLTNCCAGCTVFGSLDNCKEHCRLAKMCMLASSNMETDELLVIEAVAKTIVAEHQLWIEELNREKGA